MRRDDAEFADQELVLVYIAKKLREAQSLEKLLGEAGLDFLVEPDTYRGGVLFVRELIGAFFYVQENDEGVAKATLQAAGLKPYQPGG